MLRRCTVTAMLWVLLASTVAAQGREDGVRAFQALNARDFELAEYYATRSLADVDLAKGDRAAVHAYRGDARRHLRSFAAALQDYTAAIQLGLPPQFAARVHNNRGLVWFAAREWGAALQDYDSALELVPGFVAAMDNRATVFLMMGDLEQAVAAYNQTIAADPSNPMAYNNRGRAFLQLRFYEEAIADFTRSLALGPANPGTPLFNRGIAHEGRGDREAARADFALVLALDPEEPTYRAKFAEYGLLP